jgi:periplasmic protein CpxP/Spy
MTPRQAPATIEVLFTLSKDLAMKPWIRRSLLGLFGATIVFGGLTACGHRYEHHGWNTSPEESAKFRGRMVDRVAGKLDLNEDQKKRLGVLAERLHEQRLALMAKTPDPRAEVQALVAGDKFDRARAQTLISDKTAALNAKSPEVVAAMGDFYDSLTPAQQAKVREFTQHRRGWWHRG